MALKDNDSGVRQKYLHQEVLTASREKLLFLTYEIAIGSCKRAIMAIEENNAETANKELQTAQKAIRELQFSLRPEKAEEVTENLNRLYDFMYNELVMANLNKNRDRIGKVESMLEDLLQTWREALEKLRMEGGLSPEAERKFATPELVGGGLNISC